MVYLANHHKTPDMNLHYESICQKALSLVKDTATFIQKEIGKVSQEQIEDKELNSLVSYVDKTAEQLLVDGFASNHTYRRFSYGRRYG